MGIIDYTKLSDLLSEKGLTYYSLRKDKVVGTATIQKLQFNYGDIDTRTIAHICEFLNCQPGDFLEYRNERLRSSDEIEYQKKLEKAIEDAVYPQYGEWCKEAVIQFIKNKNICDSEEFIRNEVFNPESTLYNKENYLEEYTPKNILGNINYNKYFNQSLFCSLQEDFEGCYFKVFSDLNPDILTGDKNRDDILTDIPNEGDQQDFELLETALDEIGIDGLKKIILESIELQKEE